MQQVLSKWNRNEKGFTLVELLAVIVILGIILAIAIPAIGSILDNAKKDNADNQQELIVDAARLADANGDFADTSITVDDLISGGYLENDEDLSGSVKKVTSDSEDNNSIKYEYVPADGS